MKIANLKDNNLLQEIVSTLIFYSDKRNYEQQPAGYNTASNIELDKGTKARKLLEKLNKIC